MHDREALRKEVENLPSWAKKLVESVQKSSGQFSDKDGTVGLYFPAGSDAGDIAFLAFCELSRYAKVLTAPDPETYSIEEALQESGLNLVEALADDEDSSFDQPCVFGYRVESHAVYCHNGKWPGAPRKCRRSSADYENRHEDCPGFKANPHAIPEKSW